MKYLLGVMTATLLIVIVFNYSYHDEIALLNTILGVSTFLFGLFMAFSISDRHGRINAIREQDSEERANLILLVYYAKATSKNLYQKVLKLVDSYLMATLDYKIEDYSETSKNFQKLFEGVSTFNPKGSKQSGLHGQMLSALSNINLSRKKTISLIVDRLSGLEWGMLGFLSVVIVISLLSINSGSTISVSIVITLIISLLSLFFLLFQLDSLKWKEEARIFEPYQKTFEACGLARYYPDDIVYRNRVKKQKGKTYRVGIIPDTYPDLSTKKIILVKANAKKK